MFRFETAGESHGECLVATLTGLPAGIPISLDAINHELWRRQQGFGRGGRMKIETDRADIVSGVRHGHTIGSPIAMIIANADWKNWTESLPVEAGDPAQTQSRHAAPPRPCRSRRRHQVQLPRRPLHPRTRQRPRNHRPRRRRRRRQAVSRATSASKCSATSSPSARAASSAPSRGRKSSNSAGKDRSPARLRRSRNRRGK